MKAFSHPATVTEAYASVAIYSKTAFVSVVGVVDEEARYLLLRDRIDDEAIWTTGAARIAEALRHSPVEVVRVGLVYGSRLEDSLRLAGELRAFYPTIVTKPAKEDKKNEPRPLLRSRFDDEIHDVGLVTALDLATRTIRNRRSKAGDVFLHALGVEEYERRWRKHLKRHASVRPEVEIGRLRSRVASLEAELGRMGAAA